MVATFWCEPTGSGVVRLRRFTFSAKTEPLCPGGGGHDAWSDVVDEIPYVMVVDEYGEHWPNRPWPEDYADHPGWSTVCAAPGCGYVFDPTMPDGAHVYGRTVDEWDVQVDPLYQPTQVELAPFGWRDAPAGAMRDCRWSRKGPDGVALQVRCPRADGSAPSIGDDWVVDSRASNCTLPDDRVHYCWVRKGDPKAVPPTVTVSKDGPTCAAGAGSIQTHRWHGFLRDGELVE